MALRYFLKSHRTFSVGPSGHKAPAFAFSHEAATIGLKLGVECRQTGPESVEAAFEKMVGDKQVALHVVCLQTITAFAHQNGEFADNVFA